MTIVLPDLSLHLELPPGRARDVIVRGGRPGTTLAEIAALAEPGRVPLILLVDGRPCPAGTPLDRTRLRNGSTLSWRPGATEEHPVVGVSVVAGPDWGRGRELAAGSHVAGRSPASGCPIDDPTMAPRHAVLRVAGHGTVAVEELGVGRPVTWIGGRLRLGASLLAFEPVRPDRQESYARDAAAVPELGWRRPVIRPARVQRDDPPAIRPPAIRPPGVETEFGSGPTGIGLVSSATAVVGGVAAGLLLHQPIMILLALLGTLGAVATVLVNGVRSRRSRRAATRRAELDRRQFDAAVGAAADRFRRARALRSPWTVTPSTVHIDRLWESRVGPEERWCPTLGLGDVEWEPPVEGGAEPMTVADVGVPLDLGLGAVVGLCGSPDEVRRLARSLVLQAATRYGPADLAIVLAAEPRAARSWRWTRWLPHVVTDLADGLPGEHAAERAGDEPRGPASESGVAVVVVEPAERLTVRTSAVRRWLDRSAGRAWTLVVCAPDEVVPRLCTHLVRVHAGGAGELQVLGPDPGARFGRAGSVQRFMLCGTSGSTADRVARHLAGWFDPEAADAAAGIPTEVTLSSLLEESAGSAAAIAETWRRAGFDPAPTAVLGAAADGAIEIDLRRDGPHALVAGTTGAGKSELLRSLVVALAASTPPDLLQFVLVDYKGGSAFDGCASLPHVAGTVTDLDDRLGARMLASLEAELRHRERQLRSLDSPDLTAYRARGGTEIARLVVVVDEFAALAAELPEFMPSLVAIAQRGRSLGVHLVLATQRPSGVVDDDIRANTNLRLCLRVQDPTDAVDVIGDRRPAALPRAHPGRAMLRLGTDPLITFQAARCTGSVPVDDQVGPTLLDLHGSTSPGVDRHPDDDGVDSQLAELVARVEAAALRRESRTDGAVRRPWTDPLPVRLEASNPSELGSVDDVETQRRTPLAWDPAGGHLLVVGSIGAGTTTALARVASSRAAAVPPDRFHLFVIDGAGTGELDALAGLPHCGGVVGAADDERLTRLVTVLEQRLDSTPRRSVATAVVVVDGVGALRSRLATSELAELADRFERIVSDGPRAGVVMVFGADHGGAVPLAWLSQCPTRWVGRLADPLDAATFGVPTAAALRDAPAGRFVVEVRNGRPLDAQVMVSSTSLDDEVRSIASTWVGVVQTAEPIAACPRRVEPDELPAPSADAVVTSLPIGLGSLDLRPAVLTLHPGDHAVVLGAARTGRTNTLRLLVEQWRRARPSARVVELGGRDDHGAGRIAMNEALASVVGSDAGTPVLVVVDDAERFTDDGGRLARLLAEDRPGLHVVAASRPDALRGVGYGHWTSALRRGAVGLLLGSVQDTDGDVLGVTVPRRRLPKGPVPAGRAVLCTGGRFEPVQVAWAMERDPVFPRAGRQRGLAVAGSSGQECFG